MVIRQLPRKVVPGACPLRVLVDRSPRLIPFWGDQLALARQIRRRLGRLGAQFSAVPGGDPDQLSVSPGILLLVGDLGFLSADESLAESWLAAGERLAGEGVQLRALVPCPPDRWRSGVAKVWNAVEWENPRIQTRAAASREAKKLTVRRDLLLELLLPAIRIEPGLLREVRQLVGEKADAGTEADVWALFPDASAVAGAVDENFLFRLGAEGEASESLKSQAFEVIRKWHEGLPPLILAEESLTPVAAVADLAKAKQYLHAAFAEVRAKGLAGAPFLAEWFGSLFSSATQRNLDGEMRRDLVFTWTALRRENPQLPLPTWVSPALLAELEPELEFRHFSIVQLGNRIVLQPSRAEPPATGSVLGEIRASGSRIVVVGAGSGSIEVRVQVPSPSLELEELPPLLRLVSNLEEVELWTETRPAWASAAGRDNYGLWADLEVGGVVQRMRYIRPGRFLMGSPETENGRSDYEGPQHQVTLTKGFWLAATPCTQELWKAVMGTNPSHFKGAKRPVEQVSLDDVAFFLTKLGKGLKRGNMVARLPTEAQWEYACRAGTQTSTYAGEEEAVRKEIAWYSANSSSKTHEVAQKLANPWGLFDTLGNVWEWCADIWSGNYNYSGGRPVNPEGPDVGPDWVYHGGSWHSRARNIRAAARGRYGPGSRHDYLGFRFALDGPHPGQTRNHSD